MGELVKRDPLSFFDIDGHPLEDGNIYIGEVFSDAKENPIEIFDNKNFQGQAIQQPVRTRGGYPVDDNDMIMTGIFIREDDYSLAIEDRTGTDIFIAASNSFLVNSSKVIFSQGTAGSVDRTVQDKLKNTIHPQDFGAKADGVTDDTLAFQRAIDYISDNGGGDLSVSGDYLLSDTINLKRNVSLNGEGCCSSILRASNNLSINSPLLGNNDVSIGNIIIRNVSFTVENGSTILRNSSPFLYFSNCEKIKIKDCQLNENTVDIGIRFNNVRGGEISGCSFVGTGIDENSNTIFLEGGQDSNVIINNCDFDDINGTPIKINSQRFIVTSNNIDGASGVAIDMSRLTESGVVSHNNIERCLGGIIARGIGNNVSNNNIKLTDTFGIRATECTFLVISSNTIDGFNRNLVLSPRDSMARNSGIHVFTEEGNSQISNVAIQNNVISRATNGGLPFAIHHNGDVATANKLLIVDNTVNHFTFSDVVDFDEDQDPFQSFNRGDDKLWIGPGSVFRNNGIGISNQVNRLNSARYYELTPDASNRQTIDLYVLSSKIRIYTEYYDPATKDLMECEAFLIRGTSLLNKFSVISKTKTTNIDDKYVSIETEGTRPILLKDSSGNSVCSALLSNMEGTNGLGFALYGISKPPSAAIKLLVETES